jgi:UDP-N-acetylmuramoyl-tripeptide--D-alanyl-D-alanine ligase
VALVGERFDANEFLAEAVARGATALVASAERSGEELGVPAFLVNDTLVALGALARHRRRAWGVGGTAGGQVVGIGGSNGKTTTKELLRGALGATMRVHATRANLNNLVGVPKTLLALPMMRTLRWSRWG